MKNKIFNLMVIAFFIAAYLWTSNMDYKIAQQEQDWAESVHAVKVEQTQIQAAIDELQAQYIFTEEQLHAQNLLIWDIRERVHLDLGWELENTSWEVPVWEEE